MKIHKLSNVIALPFVLILICLMYLFFVREDDIYVLYALGPLIMVALVYMFQPQINYWWLGKNPVQLDKPILDMLNNTNPVYNSLSQEERAGFDKEIYLQTEGNAYVAKGMEKDHEVPYDVKFMLTQIPVTIERQLKNKKLKRFERVVVYKHAFPSPKHRFLHSAETDVEDGVVIISTEQAQNAFFNPQSHYNNAWHAYAEAFVKLYPNKDYPSVGNDIWETIQNISGFDQNHIKAVLGFDSIDPIPVLITLFFNNSENFKDTDLDLSLIHI